MKLFPNVKLIYNVNSDIKDGLFISQGSTEADDADSPLKKYTNNAYKPIGPWRVLTNEEIQSLISVDEQNDFSDTIALVPLPDGIKQLALRCELENAHDLNTFNYLLNNNRDAFDLLTNSLNSYASDLLFPNAEINDFGYCFNPSGLETVDYDKVSSKYFGLHIDNSSAFSVTKASNSPNRICVNLGCQNRHLLFVNLTVQTITKKILAIKKNLIIEKLGTTEIAKLFFELFPNYPVIKLVQKPFEAYIAPTDNIIHDGSTQDSNSLDISAIIKGHFDPFLFYEND